MSSLNRVMLIGRLTKDPEMRYTPNAQPVTNFSVATNRYATGPDGEKKEYTDYHNCVAWNIGKRNLAELIAQYTRKGSLVYVEGRLSTRSWESQDGQKRRATEVVVNDIQFLESRNTQPVAAGGAPAEEVHPTEPGVRDVDPDEIPF